MNHYRIRCWIAAFVMTFFLSACGAAPESPVGIWLEHANLDGRESPEELYQQALEEGILTIYSNTTRIYDTQTAFEAMYPGLITDVQFVRAADLISLLEDSDLANPLCDIVICTDNQGILSSQFVPQELLHKYVPWDMAEHILPQHNGALLDFMVEGSLLFYNSEVYDLPPVSNWWQLTEPEFAGRFYMVDPLRSHTTFAFMTTMIQHSDEMAQAYEEYYEKPLEIPEGSSAGQEFWRRLIPNITFTSSSDEALELVGMPGQENPPMAILVSSKERKAGLGYSIAPVYDIRPSCGVLVPSSVMLHGGAKNIAAAKLFIRFLLGETDGKGAGFTPYLHEGSWAVRSDVISPSSVSPEDTSFWLLDAEYLAGHQQRISDFWLELREIYGDYQP